jgi:hypothetical protein
MAWYEIFIVSVGLSLDVFTYALYKGAMLSRLDKKQILNEGHFLPTTPPMLHRKFPHHGCEYLHPQVLEQLVCRLFGVAPLKIAHDEP